MIARYSLFVALGANGVDKIGRRPDPAGEYVLYADHIAAAQPAPTPQRTDAVGVAGNGLLPCPFCGGPAFDDFDDPDGAGHIVGCDNRACSINPEKFMDHEGPDHDVRVGLRVAWNTRGKT